MKEWKSKDEKKWRGLREELYRHCTAEQWAAFEEMCRDLGEEAGGELGWAIQQCKKATGGRGMKQALTMDQVLDNEDRRA